MARHPVHIQTGEEQIASLFEALHVGQLVVDLRTGKQFRFTGGVINEPGSLMLVCLNEGGEEVNIPLPFAAVDV